jgi:hypothetical protein
VASWSGWREHLVMFHRNRYSYDSLVEGSHHDDAGASCIEVNLPNGTHYFKVSKLGLSRKTSAQKGNAHHPHVAKCAAVI